jgi:mannosyltransferase
MDFKLADTSLPKTLRIDSRALHCGLILAVAIGLRLWRLNHWSLWYDEVVTMRLAQSPGPLAMLNLIRKIDASRAPLFPLLLMGWIKLFGNSDLAARLLTALLGVLTVVLVYMTGRSVFNERTARWAAWLCALCPTLITYSQEVRMYALLLPLTVLSWWTFLAFRHTASRGHLIRYAVLLASLIYTHPVGLFMVAAHGFAYLLVRRSLVLSPKRWLSAMALTLTSVLPWLGRYLDHTPEHLLPRYPIRFLLGLPIEYIGGNSITLLPLVCLIATGMVTFCGWRLVLREPASGVAVLCWFVVPPALMYAYSFVGYPIFGPARLHLFVAPAYLLLVARGLATLSRPARLTAVVAMIPLISCGLAGQTYAPGLKADYRGFAQWLRNQDKGRVVVVLHNHDSRFPLTQFAAARYYLEPAVPVVLECGDGPSLPAIPPNGTTVYHAYCFRPAGWTIPQHEQPIKNFYGLTVTRTLCITRERQHHLEDVFIAMRVLRKLLADCGVVYLETQMSKVQCELPIFEYASDDYPTVANQSKATLNQTGISNYLFPNESAIQNLASSYDFECVSLSGPHNLMMQEHP